ncbi:MAG: glycerophosphodiester phosphodiesterase [Chloroflexota bacterium]
MLIFAHRGASGYAPENTMPAFELAREMGAGGIETDIQVSKDGVLVLVHDTKVDRTSNGTGNVADFTWQELSALDAGGWFDARFAGERIVRLDQFLDWAIPNPLEPASLVLCLEIKAPAATEATIEALAARGLTARPDLQLSSFDWDAAVRAHTALPGLVVGFLTPRFDKAEIERVLNAGLPQICPRADLLTPEMVTLAHERGLNVRAWGVGTREHLKLVYDCGADGTTLNWPDWAH